MLARPGKILSIESRMSQDDSPTVDTVGKQGLINIQPTSAGTFLFEYEDKFIEIKPLTWTVTLAKAKYEEVK